MPQLQALLANVDKYIPSSLSEVEEKNHYIDHCNFGFELPRLIAQSRVIFSNISHYLSLTSSILPKEGVLLDVGAGPGVLTGLLLEKFFPKLKGLALEPSKPMFEFGSLKVLQLLKL